MAGALAEQLFTACLLECTARKAGNVHPGASFPDLTYADLVRSAEVAAPLLAEAAHRGVGRTILDAVTATRHAVGTNSNLGIVLLLAPLAAVGKEHSLAEGIADVLKALSREDAELTYEAIRLASPGGLGSVPEGDVSASPSGTLRDMMQLAAHRDSIAREYATGFELVLRRGLSWLQQQAGDFAENRELTVIRLHLQFLAECPDTLIARKCGPDVARDASRRAAEILAANWPETTRGRTLFTAFDDWLRADGHRRNPGTTADLTAATLFAGLREAIIPVPEHLPPGKGSRERGE